LLEALYCYTTNNLDGNPNWAIEGQWAYGEPLGSGGSIYGNPDPTTGNTGSNVYGVNLSGDYDTEVGSPYYLTAGPYNCSYYKNMKLSFSRWLNSDNSQYVRNTVEVSNDGSNWVILWENTGDSDITDNSWESIELDISAVADDQEVYWFSVNWTNAFDRLYLFLCDLPSANQGFLRHGGIKNTF